MFISQYAIGFFRWVKESFRTAFRNKLSAEQLKKELRSQIMSQMDDRGVSSVESGDFVAKQSERVRVEYDKEQIEHILLMSTMKQCFEVYSVSDLNPLTVALHNPFFQN